MTAISIANGNRGHHVFLREILKPWLSWNKSVSLHRVSVLKQCFYKLAFFAKRKLLKQSFLHFTLIFQNKRGGLAKAACHVTNRP
jgi:hypothetical protein